MRACDIPAFVQWLYVAALLVGPVIGLVLGVFAGKALERARAKGEE